jgi:hypothetical protein
VITLHGLTYGRGLGNPRHRRNQPRRRYSSAIEAAHQNGSGLSRQSHTAWGAKASRYDKWEIIAGDSIARELAAGFQEVYGIVVVLSADYPGGRWARDELEAAVTKRIEENIRIVPVLYEHCERPELLRPLRYVDCTEHTEANIERQFSDLIDALNEIELNPYR